MFKLFKSLILTMGVLIPPILAYSQGDDTLQVSNIKVLSTIKLGSKIVNYTTDSDDTLATKHYVDNNIPTVEGGTVIINSIVDRIPFIKSTGNDTLTTAEGFKYTTSTTPSGGYLFSGDRNIASVTDFLGFNGVFKASSGIFGSYSYPIYIGKAGNNPAIHDARIGSSGSDKVLHFSSGINAWCNSSTADPFTFRLSNTSSTTRVMVSFTRNPNGAFTTSGTLFDIFEDTTSTLGSTAKYFNVRDLRGNKFYVDRNYTTVNNTLLANSNQTIMGDLFINGNITLGGTATGNFGVGGGGGGTGSGITVYGTPALRSFATFLNDSTLIGKSKIIDTLNNLGIGSYNLESITSGTHNIGLGHYTFRYTTTGKYNVGIGYGTLSGNTTGSHNTAVGYNSLVSSTTGSYNTSMGYNTLANCDIGSYNTAVGYISMSSSPEGTGNSAYGTYSMIINQGTYNTGIGFAALYNSLSGSYNVGLGHYAGAYLTTQSNWVILNSLNRINIAGDTTNSPIAIKQNATSSSQSIYLNGKTVIKHGLKLTALATGSVQSLLIDATGNVYAGTASSGSGNISSYGTTTAQYQIPYFTKRDTVSSNNYFKYTSTTGTFYVERPGYGTKVETHVLEGSTDVCLKTSTYNGIGLLSTNTHYLGGTLYKGIQVGTGDGLVIEKKQSLTVTDTGSFIRLVARQTAGDVWGNFIDIDDNPTTSNNRLSSILEANVDNTLRLKLRPRQAIGLTTEAYLFDTDNNLTTNNRIVSIKNQGVDKFAVKNDTIIIYKCGKVLDSLYLPYAGSGAERWLGLSRQGAVFSDSLVNAGFMLVKDIPSIKEHLSDQEDGEISWYYKDEKGNIVKTYGLAKIGRFTYQAQALMSAQEQAFRYIGELEDKLAKEKEKSAELEKRISVIEQILLKNSLK